MRLVLPSLVALLCLVVACDSTEAQLVSSEAALQDAMQGETLACAVAAAYQAADKDQLPVLGVHGSVTFALLDVPGVGRFMVWRYEGGAFQIRTAPLESSELVASGRDNVAGLLNPSGRLIDCDHPFVPGPVPTIDEATPNKLLVGADDTTIAISGSRFDRRSRAYFDGEPLVTTFESETRLSAVIPARLLSGAFHVAGVSALHVESSGSASAPFAIDLENPAPIFRELTPTSIVAGSGPVAIVVTGDFAPSARLVVGIGTGGLTPLATTVLSATQLKAILPATMASRPGRLVVKIRVPQPGGGDSDAGSFEITN